MMTTIGISYTDQEHSTNQISTSAYERNISNCRSMNSGNGHIVLSEIGFQRKTLTP